MVLQIALESLVRFEAARPAIIPIAESGHCRQVLVCLKAGQKLADHKSASQVTAHFLRGRGVFYADGQPVEAGSGSLIVLEPGRFHRIHAEEDSVILVTMTPHPARDRYPADQIDRIVGRADGPPKVP